MRIQTLKHRVREGQTHIDRKREIVTQYLFMCYRKILLQSFSIFVSCASFFLTWRQNVHKNCCYRWHISVSILTGKLFQYKFFEYFLWHQHKSWVSTNWGPCRTNLTIETKKEFPTSNWVWAINIIWGIWHRCSVWGWWRM